MRQVPCYGIIGDGRLARHFCHYLTILGIHYKQWTRKQLDAPEDVLRECDPILLLISDDAIKAFITAHPALKKHRLCHCCASLEIEDCHSAHPLMTFSHSLYDDALYTDIPFITSERGPSFEELLPGLPNPHIQIAEENKALYHALCVLSGNFSVILWQKTRRDFAEKLGIPADFLKPYCSQIFTNLIHEPDHCLTGPIARGDTKTIQRQLTALKEDPFYKVYQSVLSAYQEESQS